MKKFIVAGLLIFLTIIIFWLSNFNSNQTIISTALKTNENSTQAIELLKTYIIKDPNNLDYNFNLGKIYFSSNNSEAIKFLSKTIEISKEKIKNNPDNYILYSNIANSYLMISKMIEKKDMLEDVKTYFDKAIKLKPDDVTSYNGLANFYEITGDISKAVETYKQTLKIDSNNYDACINLLKINPSSNLTESIELCQKILYTKPDDTILFKLAKLNYENINYNESQKHLENIKSPFKESFEVQLLLASIFNCLNKLEESKKMYEKLLKTEPNNFFVNQGLATVLGKLNQSTDSIELFKKVIILYNDLNIQADFKIDYLTKNFCNLPKPFFYLGVAADRLYENQISSWAYREYLKIKPNNIKVSLKLAKVLDKSKNYYESFNVCKEIISKDTQCVEAHSLLCKLIFRNINNVSDDCIKIAHDTIILSPQCAEAYCIAVSHYVKMKDFKKAIELLKTAETKIQNNPYIYLFLGFSYFAEFSRDTNKETLRLSSNYMTKALENDLEKEKDMKEFISISYSVIGITNVAFQEFDEAKINFKKSIEFNEKNADSLYYLGLCYLKDNNMNSTYEIYYKLAMIDSQKADELNKNIIKKLTNY